MELVILVSRGSTCFLLVSSLADRRLKDYKDVINTASFSAYALF